MAKRNSIVPVRPPDLPVDERLDSWKSIAAYLRREVRTVQRWEKTEGLPVKRHGHCKVATVYAIKSELDSWWKGREPVRGSVRVVAAAKVRRRLAVLAFDNLSGDPEQEYFSDGLTEEMIAQLGRLRPDRIGVIARTTMMQYKGTQKSIEQIGRELGVDYLLEGSVRRANQRARITAQLIRVSDQTHLWAESYERALEDILAIQIEVAERIARSLTVELLPDEQAVLVGASTTSATAHDAYLRGRYSWNKRSEESFAKAIEYFRQAVELDPEYAAAHAGLADCYDTLGWYGALPAGEAYRNAQAAAMRALQINERLAEAHAALAYGKQFHEWNWEEIEKEYRRALDLDANYVTAHHWYALFLAAMGRQDEALEQIKRARKLDPLSLIVSVAEGRILHFARRFDDAIEQFRRIVELDPSFIPAHCDLGASCEEKGMLHQALAEFETCVDLSRSGTLYVAAVAEVHARLGNSDEALKILSQLQASSDKYVSPHSVAFIYASLGELDQAFSWQEKAYEERDASLVWVKVAAESDALRADMRFVDLVRRMNFPES